MIMQSEYIKAMHNNAANHRTVARELRKEVGMKRNIQVISHVLVRTSAYSTTLTMFTKSFLSLQHFNTYFKILKFFNIQIICGD